MVFAFAQGESLSILLTSSSVQSVESLVFQKSAAKSITAQAEPTRPICTSLVGFMLSSPDAMRDASVTLNSLSVFTNIVNFCNRARRETAPSDIFSLTCAAVYTSLASFVSTCN